MSSYDEYEYDDDDYAPDGCECELDWRCSLHAGLPTPEDMIATEWSHNHG